VGGTAGELGHVVVDPNGAACRCGNRGCLETVAGTEAVLRLLEPVAGRLSVADVVARAVAGDPAARRVVGDTGRSVGAAAAVLVNLLNPALVVVGGALSEAGDVLLDPLRDALARGAVPSAVDDMVVVPSALGDRAELLGAIGLVLRDDEIGVLGDGQAGTSSRMTVVRSPATGLASSRSPARTSTSSS
jgi:predicted NBD/HSP70 family sugar kinase